MKGQTGKTPLASGLPTEKSRAALEKQSKGFKYAELHRGDAACQGANADTVTNSAHVTLGQATTEEEMGQLYPKVWDWAKEIPPKRLSEFAFAPDKIGFYELGFVTNGTFEAKYAGRAKGITLRQRLGQHYAGSHNKNVRSYKNDLYYRCKVLGSEELAAFVEAVSLAALEYPWNKRNEWRQHWALES
jgi:hypothetical protein